MSVVSVEPSELHWKKELVSLRKAARILRDPETSSSLRSPSSSRSAGVASREKWVKGAVGNSSRLSSGGYPEVESRLPLLCAESPKTVSLYNWRFQPSKSSESRAKLDGKDMLSESESLNDSLDNTHDEDSKSETYLDNPRMLFKVRESNLTKPMKRTAMKFKRRSAISRNHSCRNLKSLKRPSISLKKEPAPIEHSDGTENCNSEDLQSSECDLNQISMYSSRSASPLLSKYRNFSNTSKHLLNSKKVESSVSCTPVSTSSPYIYGHQNPSTLGSWDGTTTSADGELDPLELPTSQGCCYWSRSPKYRSIGNLSSPSLSETLRRKGSTILCGSRTVNHKHQSSRSNKHKLVPKSAKGLQLLTYSCDGRGTSTIDLEESDDDLSTNFGELDLEALSRLDGKRWSLHCRSSEDLEDVALEGNKESNPDHFRSLSEKYRPTSFHDLIGQKIVVQSLTNSITRGRIAPVYLFHGPKGTGKTSTARIFAAALNCLATEETKPCGICSECTDFLSGKGRDLREVTATNKKAIDRVRYFMKTLMVAPPSHSAHYTVFIVEECHLLPSKAWSSFLKFLEEPPAHVVFIFITTDLDNVPRTLLSRCQKFLFNKIKDADISTRLEKLCSKENLEFESHALDLITLKADGSLWDAESILEQLSWLGKRIDTSLVNELVGVVSDDKLLDLLELAMSSETAETVRKARQLMDSGVDPMSLTSQLAGLIMDIIAGTYCMVDSKGSGSFFGGRSLTEAEVERLKQSLKLLSEAEKQLRVSSERQTWFTAALLQLGSVPSQDLSHSSSCRRQSSKTTEEEQTSTSKEFFVHRKKFDHLPQRSTSSSTSLSKTVDGYSTVSCNKFVEGDTSATSHNDILSGSSAFRYIRPDKLDDIWGKCIDRCHSKTLRQLLREHAKLVSISKIKGIMIASIQFNDEDIKSRAEGFLSSITNSIENVLRHRVEVKIGVLAKGEASINAVKPLNFSKSPMALEETEANKIKTEERNIQYKGNGHSHPDLLQELDLLAKEISNGSESNLPSRVLEQIRYSALQEDWNPRRPERKQDTPPQRAENIIEERRMESAYLKTAERGSSESLSRLKPEKNQILPEDDIYGHNQAVKVAVGISSQNWDAELNHELNGGRRFPKEQGGQRFDCWPMSPSLLHDNSLSRSRKENLGYESGSSAGGCNALRCWKTRRHHNKRSEVNLEVDSSVVNVRTFIFIKVMDIHINIDREHASKKILIENEEKKEKRTMFFWNEVPSPQTTNTENIYVVV
ncbi:hypothetical protein MKW94_017996 [Papaver nudicaule]|uniref:AAA+ ATPase domain-containing protein n=1 Tax=Papaver nudicaule TaxID=74823 RepID=A0AA41SJN3_PAPNU|nr:hypothetical protein [Papaver nudicaule]